MGMGGHGEAERCGLCGVAAEVHCEADAAFLCAGCDAKVHGANFLASRHIRTRVSSNGEEDGATSASSCCVSTADSAMATVGRREKRMRTAKRRSAARGEAVLEGWAKRMGLQAGPARRRAAAAGRVLRARGRDAAAPGIPLRVSMAAALWREVAGRGAAVVVRRTDTLQRLEACARVPARVVVAMAASMGRARARGPSAAEESWDECP